MVLKCARTVHSVINKFQISYMISNASFHNGATCHSRFKKVCDTGVLNKLNNLPTKVYYSSTPDSTSINIQDEDDFDSRVLKEKIPVIVDFHAEWCGPCKLLGPRLEKEVDSHQGSVVLAKVDVDDLGDLAIEHKVNVVPTVMTFKNGKKIDMFEGNIDDDLVKAFVKKAADS